MDETKPKSEFFARYPMVADILKVIGALAVLGTTGAGSCVAGVRIGESNAEARVKAVEATKDREAARIEGEARRQTDEHRAEMRRKDDELRQLTILLSSHQAALQLKEADQKRLIELTSTTPAIKVSLSGQPLAGKVVVKQPEGDRSCLNFVFWLENTTSRDIRVGGIELVTTNQWNAESADTAEIETDSRRARHWVAVDDTLTPGQRRWVRLRLCSNDPNSSSQPLDVSWALYANNYLPLRSSWVAVPTRP